MSEISFSANIKNGLTFITIPNSLFYNGKEGGDFMELNNYNLLVVITFMKTKMNMYNEVCFSIRKLIEFTGQKVDLHEGKSVDKMKEMLKFLIDKEYIEPIDKNIDIDNIKVNDFIEVLPTKDLDSDFTKIPLSVIEKILNSRYRYKNKILTYWCYLHSRIYKKSNASDNKAQVTWVSLDKISLDTGLSKETIMSYNDVLVELGLLKYINLGIKKKGKIKEKCSNIYITIDGSVSDEFIDIYLKEGVNQYKYYLKENGWTLIENKTGKF